MRIAILGAGAIGMLVAGYLKLKEEDISLIGRPESVRTIKENNLQISGVRGNFNIKIDVSENLPYRPDLLILATKTQDIDTALKNKRKFLQGAKLLTTQNGIQADALVAKYIPKRDIISSIIMFGATYLEPGKVVHNFEGNWIMGRIFGKKDGQLTKVSEVLNKIFPTVVAEISKG